MKIVYIGKDYLHLLNTLDKHEYPINSEGFNISFITYNKDIDLFVIRINIPYHMIHNKNKILVPGLPKRFFDNLKDNENENNKNIISNKFIWNWNNYYESYVVFAGKLLENGHIKTNINIKPMVLIDPKTDYKLSNKYSKIPKKSRSIMLEDFRLINLKNKIFLMDSTMSEIRQVKIENNKIKYGKINYKYICQSDVNHNSYFKIYEKNWSIYKSNFIDNTINIYFFHDFLEDGIYGVHFTPNKCKLNRLVEFKKDKIPNHSNKILAFSFGSTTYTKDQYVYGVGHIKIMNYREKLSEIDKNSNEYLIQKKIQLIHKALKTVFKNKYRYALKRIYFLYYFRYDKKRKVFDFSDGFLPIVPVPYIMSIVFPTTLVEKYGKLYVGMGYGDYTNVIGITTVKEIDNLLVHNAEYFNLSSYKFNIMKTDH